MAPGGRSTLQCVHSDILGPPGGAIGASKSAARGGIMPGSEQAASVNETRTAAALTLPRMMAHNPSAVQTSTRKK